MSLLLETTLGDIAIDLDLEGSPNLCRNVLKLAKSRYYTNTLFYNVQPGRFCQLGDAKGDGTGGSSIYGLIDSIRNTNNGVVLGDETESLKRFMKSSGRALTKAELGQKGRVVAVEMDGVRDTIGSQFIITIDSGEGRALDGLFNDDNVVNNSNIIFMEGGGDGLDGTGQQNFLSLGVVSEDENDILTKMNSQYCDKGGRPYADVRIIRAHVLDDPYEDPPGMEELLKLKKVTLLQKSDLPQEHAICARWLSSASPTYDRPPSETVEIRISAAEDDFDEEEDKKRQKALLEKEDKSREVLLEMLGDLPSADLKPPENVLFVCKLNSVTDDEDLQLIFSRFDPDVKAEIIRDSITGDSLQYAFIEFTTKEQCTEAYFKMNNALVDDRRIKVDFSQSVAKEWNKYYQRRRQRSSMNGQKKRGSGYYNSRHGPSGNVKRMKDVAHPEQRHNLDVARNMSKRGSNNYEQSRNDNVETRKNIVNRHHRRSRSPSYRSASSSSTRPTKERRSKSDERHERRRSKHDRHRSRHRHRKREDGSRKRKSREKRYANESDEESRSASRRRRKSSHRSHRRR